MDAIHSGASLHLIAWLCEAGTKTRGVSVEKGDTLLGDTLRSTLAEVMARRRGVRDGIELELEISGRENSTRGSDGEDDARTCGRAEATRRDTWTTTTRAERRGEAVRDERARRVRIHRIRRVDSVARVCRA